MRFTSRLLVTLLFCAFTTTVAHADRIAVYPASGTADDVKRNEVTSAIVAQLAGLHHDAIHGVALRRPGNGAEPTTRVDMLAAATANSAQWTLTAQVAPLAGQYRLHLSAAYLPTGRMEEIELNVIDVEEEARLRDVLGALIRASGLGPDLLRLTNDAAAAARAAQDRANEEARLQREAADRQAAEARAQQEAHMQREAAERARQESAEREAREQAQREATERERRDREAREALVPYGSTQEPPWIVQAGFGFSGLVVAPGRGGAIGDFRARVGYAVPRATGFEPRAGLDLSFGSASSVNIMVGAVYLVSPFSVPISIGGGAEAGIYIGTSGTRDPYFIARASANIAWRILDRFYLEGSLPELTYISAGALGIGAHVRLGYRF